MKRPFGARERTGFGCHSDLSGAPTAVRCLRQGWRAPHPDTLLDPWLVAHLARRRLEDLAAELSTRPVSKIDSAPSVFCSTIIAVTPLSRMGADYLDFRLTHTVPLVDNRPAGNARAPSPAHPGRLILPERAGRGRSGGCSAPALGSSAENSLTTAQAFRGPERRHVVEDLEGRSGFRQRKPGQLRAREDVHVGRQRRGIVERSDTVEA